MTSLKRHFLKRFSFNLHKIFRDDVKLLSHKVLKVSCRYLELCRSYGEYPGGGNIHPPPPGAAVRGLTLIGLYGMLCLSSETAWSKKH